MKIRIQELRLRCSNERETISFKGYNYFHGPVGAGKTTIAKLIDYCLGGSFEPTPVLQPLFSGAELDLEVAGRQLSLSRDRDSDTLRAQWDEGNDPLDVVIPARRAGGILVPNTQIAVLSDLFFHLAGLKPPRVRKSKARDDTELVRLSLRDLLWYCYLDQDSMDSSFFSLDDHSNPIVRLKSLDVLRFIVGFHQEKVSELEAEIARLRMERMRCEAAEAAIREAFSEEQFSSTQELDSQIQRTAERLESTRDELREARRLMQELTTHATDTLRQEGRGLSSELAEVERAVLDLEASIQKDRSHRNTLRHLALRHRRALSARAELSGIGFVQCPQCFQDLSPRGPNDCSLCGQVIAARAGAMDDEVADADAKARADELDERINLQSKEVLRLRSQASELASEKKRVDYELNQASQHYDSAYLSTHLDLEKRQARFAQQLSDLNKLRALASKVDTLRVQAADLEAEETRLRAELRHERTLAERDRTNIALLEKLFLDCLLRARIPGIEEEDTVRIAPPHFLPEVEGRDAGNLVTTTFANMSSGGKKNLFKCCFAIAIHRLARRNEAFLPELLIIDSPMKNISERVNREQFVGFNQMLYELAESELSGTQFIVMDKEFFAPNRDVKLDLFVRRMTPNDAEAPPLLRSHLGTSPSGS